MLDDELLTEYNSLRNQWSSEFNSWYGKAKEIVVAAGENLEARKFKNEDICMKLLEDFKGLSKSTLYEHAPEKWKRSYTKPQSPDSDYSFRPWVPLIREFKDLALQDYLLWSKIVEQSTSHEQVMEALDAKLNSKESIDQLESIRTNWKADQSRVREFLDNRQKVEAMELLEILRRSPNETVRFLAKEYHVSAKRIAYLIKQDQKKTIT